MSIYGYTANLRFKLIGYNSPTWHEEEYSNWRNLDSILSDLDVGSFPFAVTTGSANAFVVAYTPAITSYTSGRIISFLTNFAPTGATTINVNGLGAKALKLAGEDLTANLIKSGQYVRAIYDGTAFQIILPGTSVTSGTLFYGASGTTADASANEFVIESNGSVGMSLLSPNGTAQKILFGRAASATAGGFVYDHATDRLTIRVGIADLGYFSSAGWNGPVVGAVTGNVTGNLIGNVSGDVNGNVTGALTGNASSATILATGRTIAMTGDVTYTSGSFNGSGNVTGVGTIAANAVSNTKLADMAAATLKGRAVGGGTGDPEDLTIASLNYLLGLTGKIFASATSTVQAGELECNGAAISRTTYANLFAVIGTAWGTGDGSTTFNLPDLRGYTLRGWDNGRGIDTSRAFASTQADQVGGHTHVVGWVRDNARYDGGGGNFALTSASTGTTFTSDNNATGAETRGKNIAVMYVIKI